MVFLWILRLVDRPSRPRCSAQVRRRQGGSWSRRGQDGPVGLLGCGVKVAPPLCPFVTEELWQRLPRTFAVSSIMVAPYPSPSDVDTFDDQEAEQGTSLVLETVTGARSLRAQYAASEQAGPLPLRVLE